MLTIDHADRLTALLHDYRSMSDRHKATLDPYLDTDGDVDPEYEDAYVRRERRNAREAQQWLEQAMATLTACVALPDGQQVTIVGADDQRFTVTTGSVDDDAREAFTRGQCHALARAVCDATGWPMAVIISADCRFDADLCSSSPVVADVCGCQLDHVVAVRPDGAHVDINGVHAPGAVPGYEDQEALEMDEGLWDLILRSPLWRRPALDVARTIVSPLLASLPEPLANPARGQRI